MRSVPQLAAAPITPREHGPVLLQHRAVLLAQADDRGDDVLSRWTLEDDYRAMPVVSCSVANLTNIIPTRRPNSPIIIKEEGVAQPCSNFYEVIIVITVKSISPITLTEIIG
ncbi:hypothetical protein A3D73_04260 [Candidatus Uhrbacteria bacterium RIFCSPHIGHO2_02_FULL_60_44]|nr:MAG: hypothetical protein A3D73_04260 [Candidatus Uhrbacteria bacterium RIFCSPHIGHO2_02_FULL_60_44]